MYMEAKRKSIFVPPMQEKRPSKTALSQAAVDRFKEKREAAMLMNIPFEPDESDMMIDPSLLVGPLYDDSKSRSKALQDQLGDITERLHKTLYEFNTLDEFEEDKELVSDVQNTINTMEAGQTKAQLKLFAHQYEDISTALDDSNKEREDVLLTLADWFLTDHTDMEDIKDALDENEESELKDSYNETMAIFEKVKRLGHQIQEDKSRGRNTKYLQEEKHRLEKTAVNNIKEMKEAHKEVIKTKPKEEAPWKHAANEIVGLLQRVRSENVDEIEELTKSLKDLFGQLEKLQKHNQSLTKDLNDKKKLVETFGDENSELTKEVTNLRAKVCRFEKDLDSAQKFIKSQFGPKMESKKKEDETEEIHRTVSDFLKQFSEDDGKLGRMPSDPALLRTQIRDQHEAMRSITQELELLQKTIAELKEDLTLKTEKIYKLEDENASLKDRGDHALTRTNLSVVGLAVSPSAHTQLCSRCKNQISHSPSSSSLPKSKRSGGDLKESHSSEDFQKMVRKCNYYKKALADTEMRLSQAYKDLSDARQLAQIESPEELTPRIQEDRGASEESDMSTDEEDIDQMAEIDDTSREGDLTGATDAQGLPKAPRPKPKQKPKRRDKEMTMSASFVKKTKEPRGRGPKVDQAPLPPAQQDVPQAPPGPVPKNEREAALFQVGDLQGRLNMLIQEIMAFVTEIGKMLEPDEEEDQSKLSWKTYEFGKTENKQAKNQANQQKAVNSGKQLKCQALLNGQRAVAFVREAYNMLSQSLNLQHDDYELIYRSYKHYQKFRSMQQAMLQHHISMFGNQRGQQGFLTSHGFGQGTIARARTPMGGAFPWERKEGQIEGKRPLSAGSFVSEESADSSKPHLKETIKVLGIRKSKSELDLGHATDVTAEDMPVTTADNLLMNLNKMQTPQMEKIVNKEEARISKATIPKKGLIKLTALDYEKKDPEVFEKQKLQIQIGKEQEMRGEQAKEFTAKKKTKPMSHAKMLIRRKDIMEQVQMGTKRIEEEQKQVQKDEQSEKELSDYTVNDLLHFNVGGGLSFKPRKTAGDKESGKSKPPPVILPSLTMPAPFGK